MVDNSQGEIDRDSFYQWDGGLFEIKDKIDKLKESEHRRQLKTRDSWKERALREVRKKLFFSIARYCETDTWTDVYVVIINV